MSRRSRIRIMYRDKTCKEALWFPGDSHMFLCAPARRGKFTCVQAQILASFDGSIFAFDPKGQACAITARYRSQVLGQKVQRLDPFNHMETRPGVKWLPPKAKFDPLSRLDPKSDAFGSDADNLAEAFIPYNSYADPHWVDGGRHLLSGFCMYVKAKWPRESFVKVYKLISGPDVIENAREACVWAEANGMGPFISGRLSALVAKGAWENKETLSKLSAVTTPLQFMGNACMAESMSETTISFERMKREKITTYAILPGKYLNGNCSNWSRVVNACGVYGFMEEPSKAVPVLVMIDEFKAAVGRLTVIETAMGLGSGYGFQLLNIFQNLGQLQELYPTRGSWETFLANSGCQIFFAPADKTTSDYISDMTGVREVRTVQKSFSERQDGTLGVNLGFGEHARKHMLPHETRDMGNDEAIVFGEGIPGTIRAGRKPYYKDPAFMNLFDPDPYEFKG